MVTLKEDIMEGEPQQSENVKVVVRVRPLNDSEKSSDFRSIVHVDNINGMVKLENVSSSRENPPKVFTFDTVFPPEVKQASLLSVKNKEKCFQVKNVDSKIYLKSQALPGFVLHFKYKMMECD